jgi:hypothetical protein
MASPSKEPSSSRHLGDAWSGLRGLLQQAYSTKPIKGILGKAGLAISTISYTGTYKGPVLDEADKLVSALPDAARDKFVVACVQEILTFERTKASSLSKLGRKAEDQTLHDLGLVLGRFGHHLSEFEPAGSLGGLDGLRSDGLDRREVHRAIREFHRAVWDYNDSLDWVQRLSREPGDDEDDAANSSRAATREYCGGRNVGAWQRAAAALPVILRAGEHFAIPAGDQGCHCRLPAQC